MGAAFVWAIWALVTWQIYGHSHALALMVAAAGFAWFYVSTARYFNHRR